MPVITLPDGSKRPFDGVVTVMEVAQSIGSGLAKQEDAVTNGNSSGRVISTDPPYYDNIGYADLSDFFYVWLRKNLKPFVPSTFETMAVPKAEELVATPYRHNGAYAAEAFFMNGMKNAIRALSRSPLIFRQRSRRSTAYVAVPSLGVR